MPDIKTIKDFAREVSLSEPQLDVLRRASRKYKDYYGRDKTKIYNGEVSTYAVMSATLKILTDLGLIIKGHRINDKSERQELFQRARSLILEAWTLTEKTLSPFTELKTKDGFTLAWREVYGTLSVAKGIDNKLSETCLLITEAGRKVAADWKKVIGAEEE